MELNNIICTLEKEQKRIENELHINHGYPKGTQTIFSECLSEAIKILKEK